MPVELAGLTLAHLTSIMTWERARIARHPVPGMRGDLAQTLGRPSVEVALSGIFYGTSAPDDLDALRQAQLAEQPVDFFVQAVDDSEITQTLSFSQVLIAGLQVSELADLLASVPSFGDPTQKLPSMLDAFAPVATGGVTVLTAIRDLFGQGG